MNTKPRRLPAGGAFSSAATPTSNDAHTLTTNDGQHLVLGRVMEGAPLYGNLAKSGRDRALSQQTLALIRQRHFAMSGPRALPATVLAAGQC
jgi:hypothetical protein